MSSVYITLKTEANKKFEIVIKNIVYITIIKYGSETSFISEFTKNFIELKTQIELVANNEGR